MSIDSHMHTSSDLVQMQSLPLDMKVWMTKERIRAWYESWCRVEIYNSKTQKTRFVAVDCRDGYKDPKLYKDEEVVNTFEGAVCVTFSGGKDSTVLKHIVDSMYDDVPALFVNTGLEYPEIQKFVNDIRKGLYPSFNSNVHILRPELRFDKVISEIGYPVIGKIQSEAINQVRKNISDGTYTFRCLLMGIDVDNAKTMGLKLPDEEMIERYKKTYDGSKYNYKRWKPLIEAPFLISSDCCSIMKKKPSLSYQKETGRVPFIGTMATESMIRETAWLKHGCNAFDGKHPSSQPMSFWTENDVLEYIRKYNVPYARVYGDIVETGKMINRATGEVPELKTTGCSRTGCMFCMFGVHLRNDKRFVTMKQTHPNQYNYCMKSVAEGGLGLKDVIDWMNENCNTHIEY